MSESKSDPRLAVHEDESSDAFGVPLPPQPTSAAAAAIPTDEDSSTTTSTGGTTLVRAGSSAEQSGHALPPPPPYTPKQNNEPSNDQATPSVLADSFQRQRTTSKQQRPDSVQEEHQHPAANLPDDMADYGQEVIQLPKTFVVKYLGQEDASGLWGIKYTRKPVDEMVGAAKNLKPPVSLPVVKLEVSTEGIKMTNSGTNLGKSKTAAPVIDEEFPIDTISYGVQDLVYTRVFAVIIVRESDNVVEKHPFRCYAFVCDSRGNARRLTLALAKAFQEFSKALKSADGDPAKKASLMRPKKLAIDLRSAEEIQKDMIQEEDSEA